MWAADHNVGTCDWWFPDMRYNALITSQFKLCGGVVLREGGVTILSQPIGMGHMVSVSDGIKLAEWAKLIWKKLPAIGPALKRRKRKQLMLHYRHQHKGVTESMRNWAGEMVRVPPDLSLIGDRVVKMCTEFRRGMGNLLDLPEHKLHCCLKMYQPSEAGAGREIANWASSTPGDGRSKRPPSTVFPTECSVVAALQGQYDGFTQWPRFTCFSCNNLPARADKFCCPRKEWTKSYKSTMVLAIRFVQDSTHETFDDIGFLAFDSPDLNAFADMPDIYDYIERPQDYNAILNDTAAFHLGASYADAFATVMHGFYNPKTHCAGEDYVKRVTVSLNTSIVKSITAGKPSGGAV